MAVGQGRRSRSQAAGVDRELVHFLRDHLGQIHPKSFATSPSIAPRSATWATGSADRCAPTSPTSTRAIYSLPALLAEIRTTYEKDVAMRYDQLMRRLKAVDLLSIDDMAVARTNDWMLEQLYAVGEDQRFKRTHAKRAGELGLEPPT